MVKIPENGSIVPCNIRTNPTGGGVRPIFNPENNARALLNNVEKQSKQFDLLTPLPERLEAVGDKFLNAQAIKNLNYQEKNLIVNKAQEIFIEEKEDYLDLKTRGVVNNFFSSLIEKLALAETGKVAEQKGLTTVNSRVILEAASSKQDNTEVFLDKFSNLLEKTLIKYPGYDRYPNVNHSLAELLDTHLDSSPVDKEKTNNPLREILITTLKLADHHFKCEKDHNEQPFSRILKIGDSSIRGKDRDGQSRYEELGGLGAEVNGITLRKDFAEPLERLLNALQIVMPAGKFKDTEYPYLNALALETATDKIRNSL